MRLLIFILSAVVSIGFGEVFVRILADHNQQIRTLSYNPYHVTDFDRIVDLKTLQSSTNCSLLPGSEHMGFIANSHGFLFPELDYKKKDNEYRIVFLGDSFTVGVVPYKYNFTQLIQDQLNSSKTKYPYTFQSINLGISCIGPGLYQKTLEIEGIRYDPDLVVMVFYTGNDFTDDVGNIRYLNEELSPKNHKILEKLYRSKLFAVFYNINELGIVPSYLSGMGRVWHGQSSELGRFTNLEYPYNPHKPTYTKDKYFAITKFITGQYYESAYKQWTPVQEKILATKRIAEESGARFVVVIMPAEIQVYPDLLDELFEKYGMNRDDVDPMLPQIALQEFFDQYGVDYIDLFSRYSEASRSGILYQPYDSHINTYGNQIVSDELYRYILDNGLIDKSTH